MLVSLFTGVLSRLFAGKLLGSLRKPTQVSSSCALKVAIVCLLPLLSPPPRK